MAQTPEQKVVSTFRKEAVKLGVGKVVNYHGTMYSDTGHPDMMCLCLGAKVFYVEAKAEVPTPTENQKAYGTDLAKLGFLVFVLGSRGINRILADGSLEKISYVKPSQVGGVSIQQLTRERTKELIDYLEGGG